MVFKICFLFQAVDPAPVPWENKLYLAALGVGVGSSLGFMFPFMNTPAYYCHHVGKVPKVKMALYSFPSVWLCLGVLWFSLCYWGPYLWDPEDKGIMPVPKPLTSLGLISAAGGGGALPPAGGGGGAPPAGGGGGAPPAEGGGGAPPADGGGDAPSAPPDEGGGAPPAAPEEAPPAPAPEEG
ncbi:hypothetical protein ABMA27_014625 [Loxostege sticticalis]|uniref:Uncharacterized protein n=1 Tax=Loxostege sticticalis TaxID=481309 RepID=A0ABR3I9J5_LOXSC